MVALLLKSCIERIAELENQRECGDRAQAAVAMEELRRRLEQGRGILRRLAELHGIKS